MEIWYTEHYFPVSFTLFPIIFFFSLFGFRSPLLSNSLLISFPPTIKKFQFVGYFFDGFPLDTLQSRFDSWRISAISRPIIQYLDIRNMIFYVFYSHFSFYKINFFL